MSTLESAVMNHRLRRLTEPRAIAKRNNAGTLAQTSASMKR